MNNKQPRKLKAKWLMVSLIVALVVMMFMVAILVRRPLLAVSTFEQCRTVGGALLESYPEQCMIDGKTFTNENQSVDRDVNGLVGLTEQAVLDKALAENKPARVVERDGESLVVDMSFMPGRLNLYVKDGQVYKVQVEGEEG